MTPTTIQTHTTNTEHEASKKHAPVLARSVGRKATITKDELFQAALNLIGPEKSIASLSLREVAREAGIAPNSFYRHFKDTMRRGRNPAVKRRNGHTEILGHILGGHSAGQ